MTGALRSLPDTANRMIASLEVETADHLRQRHSLEAREEAASTLPLTRRRVASSVLALYG